MNVVNGIYRRFSGEMPQSKSWGNRMESCWLGCDRRDAVKLTFGREAVECRGGRAAADKETVMSKRSLRGVMKVFLAGLLLALGVTAGAQTFRGSILGTVTDSSGASIAGATVTVKNTDTGLVRSVTKIGRAH